MEEVKKLRAFPPVHMVLVYWEHTGWVIYKLVKVGGNEVDIFLPSAKLSVFVVSAVSPYYKEQVEIKAV